MRIVEIAAFPKGGHRNQTINGTLKNIPDGWAVIPDNMETPSFPFGKVIAKEINGVMTVTKWIEGTIPKIEEVEEAEQPVSELEQLRADVDYIAVMTGVEL